jgi:hypothetical protein
METRRIKVITLRGTNFELITNAQTLGDIYPELSDRGINIEQSFFSLDGDSVLTSGQASLPNGDIKIYVSPKRTKSGYYESSSLDYEDFQVNIYEELAILKDRVISLERRLLERREEIQNNDNLTSGDKIVLEKLSRVESW